MTGIAKKGKERFQKNKKSSDRAKLRFLTSNRSPANNLRKREEKRSKERRER